MSDIFCKRGVERAYAACVSAVEDAVADAVSAVFPGNETAATTIWDKLEPELDARLRHVFEENVELAESIAESGQREAYEHGWTDGLREGRVEGRAEGQAAGRPNCPECNRPLVSNRHTAVYTCEGCRREFQLTETYLVNRP